MNPHFITAEPLRGQRNETGARGCSAVETCAYRSRQLATDALLTAAPAEHSDDQKASSSLERLLPGGARQPARQHPNSASLPLGLPWRGASQGERSRLQAKRLEQRRGEGFEPSNDEAAVNGFRDRHSTVPDGLPVPRTVVPAQKVQSTRSVDAGHGFVPSVDGGQLACSDVLASINGAGGSATCGLRSHHPLRGSLHP
jgi:hypothetical protein